MELMGQSLYVVLGVSLCALFLFRLLCAFTYATFFSPLRNVPGPFLAKYTDLWHLWRVWRGQFEQDDVALHKKYGASMSSETSQTKAITKSNPSSLRTHRPLRTEQIQHTASYGQQDHIWQRA